jgi:signal transduction histidine kinase
MLNPPTDIDQSDRDAKLALLESVVDAIDQGFVVWNDDNNIIFCNQRFGDIMGYPPEMTQPGSPAKTLLRYDLLQEGAHSEQDLTALEEAVEAGEKRMISSRHAHIHERFTHRSGREVFVQRYSVDGLGHISTYMDISPMRDVEGELLKKSNQLETALNSIDQGVAIWNQGKDRRLELCNNQYLDLMEYPRELGTPGTHVLKFLTFDAKRGGMGPGDPEVLAQAYLERVDPFFGDKVDDFEETMSGKTLYVRRREVENFGSLSTFTDVTPLKEVEDELRVTQTKLQDQVKQLQRREAELDQARTELSDLNDDKDRLFSILAHDLIGPFNAIIGFSGLLKERAELLTPTKIVESADAINEAATGLHQLLANLLEWARSQMSGGSIELNDVNLETIIADVAELFLALSRQKGVDIVCRLQPVTLSTDTNMIAAVVRNLTANAIKFTPEGGRITLELATEETQAVIKVADTGTGMPEEQVKYIFSLEGVNSTTGTGGETGTGLGLQVCKDFVEQLGGSISIISKPGEGTSFRVALPLSGPNEP